MALGARSLVLALVITANMLATACGGGDGDPDGDRGGDGGGRRSPGGASLPLPRTEVAGAAWGGRIAVGGGLTAEGAASDRVDVYEPAGDRWVAVPPLPMPLHHFGMASVGERVFVAGGYTSGPQGEWQARAEVFSLGIGEASWRGEPALLQPRGGLAMVAAGESLIVVGGVAGAGPSTTTELLDPGSGGWRAGPMMAEPRDHLAATVSNGRVYAIAGRLGGLDTNKASVESWAPGEPAWRAEPALKKARGGIGAAEVDGRPCVAGGEEPGGTIAGVECLSGGAWTEVGRLDEARHGLAVVALGPDLHVIGGGSEPGLFVSATHEVLDLPR